MSSKKGPYILLGILFFLAAMVVGVQIGKRVEKENKKTQLQLSLTPAAPEFTPTNPPQLIYENYEHKGCGITFTIPSSLKATQESSQSAILVGEKTAIELSCERNNPLLDWLNEAKTATAEVQLGTQTIKGKVLTDGDSEYSVFTTVNPRNGKRLTIQIEKSFVPLVERTLEFSL